MRTAHEKVYADYGKGKEAQNHKRKAVEILTKDNSKQPKIHSYLSSSIVMKNCVDLVVEDGRPFKMFSDAPMKALISLAKKGANEKIEIYPESVQKAVQKAAEDKRQEIKAALSGKILSLALDMATCMQRSFLGEFILFVF